MTGNMLHEKAEKKKNVCFRNVYRIQELIGMIPQHIMRYPMMLAQIQGYAEKEG